MTRRFDFVSDEADRAVLARAADIVSSAERWRKLCFSHFLTEHEQSEIELRLKPVLNDGCGFFGGYDKASRRVFCASPVGFGAAAEEDYPIRAVTMHLPKDCRVTHRDILGSLMALKLKRETIGDILTGDRIAVVFLLPAAAELVLNELDKVGGAGVKCEEGKPEILPEPYRTERQEGVVSSLRTDAVVSLFCKTSRSETAKLISQGLVAKNSQTVTSPSKEIEPQDKISVRGYGKFQLESVGGATKKGRIRIIYNKFV